MFIKKITIIFLLFGLGLTSCNYFKKDKEDNTMRNLGILLLLSNTNTSSSCSGTSGMVICIPVGIAE